MRKNEMRLFVSVAFLVALFVFSGDAINLRRGRKRFWGKDPLKDLLKLIG